MNKYVEVAYGSVANRGSVVNADLLPQIASKCTGEMYNSYYHFDEELVEHFKIRKTIKGYRGKYYLDYPVIDIDKGTDTDEFVLQRARMLLERITDDFHIPLELVGIHFSGRGYHITLPNIFRFNPSNTLPATVKQTMEKYFPEGDSIYDGARLFRTPFTLNTKSGLYKIGLSEDEIFSLTAEEIHTLAKERDMLRLPAPEPYPEPLPDYSHLVEYTAPVTYSELAKTGPYVTCVQKMFNEGPVQGSRHNKMLRIASAWRHFNLPEPACASALADWSNLEPYEVKRVVHDVYHGGTEKKGYNKFGCTDQLMAKYCDSKCVYYKNKNYSSDAVTAQEAENKLINEIATDSYKPIFDLKDIYQCKSFKIYPGEVIALAGDTGLGKSAIAQNLCVALENVPIIYFTLENSLRMHFRRLLQIAHGLTREEVESHYRKMAQLGIKNNGLAESLKHIINVTLPPTTEGLRKIIEDFKPQLLVIDTLDDIEVPEASDVTSQTNMLAKQLKLIANQYDIAIIVIAHMNKEGVKGSFGKPAQVSLASIKGSSSIYQKFDKVLAWEGNIDLNQRKLSSLKARDENKITLYFNYNTDTFRMEQMTAKGPVYSQNKTTSIERIEYV